MLKHLLSIDQFDNEAIKHLFHIAHRMEPIARRQKTCHILEGAILGNLFFEASTRTRISFHAAFSRLGGSVCDTTGFTFSSMAKGESLSDTSRVLAGYCDVIVLRHPDKGSVAEFAQHINIPVINGGDGPGEHPSQALLDLYTIEREFENLKRPLKGAHILLTGDLKYGRTVHSLVKLLALQEPLHISFVAPSGLEIPEELISLLLNHHHQVETKDSLHKLSKPVDVVYATRIQKERFDEMSLKNFQGLSQDFVVNRAFLDQFGTPQAIVMHPLPRDSRLGANDLSTDLNNDPRLAIFRQADNGIPIRMAIFALLLGIENDFEKDLRPVQWRVPTHYGAYSSEVLSNNTTLVG